MPEVTAATPRTYELLHGHVSPETAYVVEDYPYGFRLRCKMRHWIETSERHGQRHMQQTTNPKRGHAWNKPKGSVYSPMLMLFLDADEHVKSYGVHGRAGDCEAFIAFEASGLFRQLDDEQMGRYVLLRNESMKANARTWEQGRRMVCWLDGIVRDNPLLVPPDGSQPADSDVMTLKEVAAQWVDDQRESWQHERPLAYAPVFSRFFSGVRRPGPTVEAFLKGQMP